LKETCSTPRRKKLVYGGMKGLSGHIARLTRRGWRLRMMQVDYWKNGKIVYIVELEKDK